MSQKQIKFYLDTDDKVQGEINTELERLAKRRQLTTSMIDACRLLLSLKEGSTDVLFELFPELEHVLTSNSPDSDELESIRRRLERLESKEILSNIPPVADNGYQMVEQPLPPLPPAVQMKPPAADFGTKLTVERKTNGESDGSAADNLLASLANF